MDNPKKVSPNEIGLEIGLVLSRFFLNTEHLHFGYWPDGLSVNLDNLKEAQDYHSNQILESIVSFHLTLDMLNRGYGTTKKFLISKKKMSPILKH